MPALFDTNAVSDLMYDHPVITARAASYSSTLHTSTVVVGEVRFGVLRLPVGNRRTDLEVRARRILSAVRKEPVTDVIADRYGQLRADLEARGLNLGDNDLWIAATALALNYTLVTRDAIFAQIPGLTVEDWTR